uniref:Uncharacterized protein n=1 Tax=Pyrodinium bahamense TaxID=73915 RepID=A0A7S0FAA0_9DINO
MDSRTKLQAETAELRVKPETMEPRVKVRLFFSELVAEVLEALLEAGWLWLGLSGSAGARQRFGLAPAPFGLGGLLVLGLAGARSSSSQTLQAKGAPSLLLRMLGLRRPRLSRPRWPPEPPSRGDRRGHGSSPGNTSNDVRESCSASCQAPGPINVKHSRVSTRAFSGMLESRERRELTELIARFSRQQARCFFSERGYAGHQSWQHIGVREGLACGCQQHA